MPICVITVTSMHGMWTLSQAPPTINTCTRGRALVRERLAEVEAELT